MQIFFFLRSAVIPGITELSLEKYSRGEILDWDWHFKLSPGLQSCEFGSRLLH